MKLKKLIASVLAFTMVVAIPHQISHAENNPTPESFATIEDSIDSNPHMKNAIENIRKVQENYNKATFAHQKHNILKNRLAIVNSELIALEKLENDPPVSIHFLDSHINPEDVKNRIRALRFEKDFLTKLKQNTEDPFYISALRVAIPASLSALSGTIGAGAILMQQADAPIWDILSILGPATSIGCAIWGLKNLYKLIF